MVAVWMGTADKAVAAVLCLVFAVAMVVLCWPVKR